MTTMRNTTYLWVALSISGALFSVGAVAQDRKPMDVEKARVVEHWTPERRAAAIPRDLVIDPRGLGYLRHPNGTLQPYGHDTPAQAEQRSPTPSPFAKPGGGSGDADGPLIQAMDPAAGQSIGASYTFKATVTDTPSGVKSVSFKIQKSGGITQSFSPAKGANDVWSIALNGFTDGSWSWSVVAKDNAAGGGNTSTKTANFTVATGGGSGGGGDGTLTNEQWTSEGTVQSAAGRIYFEMPSNIKWTRWTGYVCSGTVATDGTSQRSIIVTAAHCVYDDANKAFARNVMFIPNQAGGGSTTDRNCSNDPIGCWMPSFGVVDVDWTSRTFPNNVAWDYAYYVVKDSTAHTQGQNSTVTDALDAEAGSLGLSFNEPLHDTTADHTDYTYALGYSYSEDPKFMYCAQDLATYDTANWLLGSCGLTGGSSGGPWVQTMDTTTGSGPIISVNSWGYTNQLGMWGPKLFGTSARCVFDLAKNQSINTVGGAIWSGGTTCPPN